MTVRKVNIFSLCVLALLPAFLLCKFYIVGHESDWIPFLFMLFLVIIAWGIGILLGLGLAVVVKRPSMEPYLHLTSQLAVIVTLLVYVVKVTYADKAHLHD